VIPINALPFTRIVACDFEFGGGPGERPEIRCGVFKELRSGKVVKLWVSELGPKPPFPTDSNTLWLAYYASAEINCFLALGWSMPAYVLDLFTEFRCAVNGMDVGGRLIDALAYYGLDTIGATEKEDMRALAMRGGPYTHAEICALLAYCLSDVDALERLLPRLLPTIRLDHALHRGRTMIASARMEHAGVPIDTLGLERTKEGWEAIRIKLVDEFDPNREIYDGTSFNEDKYAAWLTRNGIGWPRHSDNPRYRPKPGSRPNDLDLRDETFRQMSRLRPELARVHELRTSLSKLRLNDLQIGRDGRNRTLLSAFRARTSRNQPSNSKSIMGPARWIRGFIQPPEGYGLAYLDYEQQEFGIAAAYSGDGNMIAAYQDQHGDPYMRFAILAGAAPADARRKNPDGTEAEWERVRNQFKTVVLATQYGQTAEGMAMRTGMPVVLARDLMRRHRMTFPTFWKSDRAVRSATLHNKIETVFGWPIHVQADFNPRSLRNFPMQANGAEMLRLACCLATERGVEVCLPVHDAMFIVAPVEKLAEHIALAKTCMADASRDVLFGFELRTEAKPACWPNRYMDKDGKEMWDRVMKLLGGRNA
jgi:DNA polymerase I